MIAHKTTFVAVFALAACSKFDADIYIPVGPQVVVRSAYTGASGISETPVHQDQILETDSVAGAFTAGGVEIPTAPLITAAAVIPGQTPATSLWGAADGAIYERGFIPNDAAGWDEMYEAKRIGIASAPVRAVRIVQNLSRENRGLVAIGLDNQPGEILDGGKPLSTINEDAWLTEAEHVATVVVEPKVILATSSMAVVIGTGGSEIFTLNSKPPLTTLAAAAFSGTPVAAALWPTDQATSFFVVTHSPASIVHCALAAPRDCVTVVDLSAGGTTPSSMLALSLLDLGPRLYVAVSPRTIRTYDITNPRAPTVVDGGELTVPADILLVAGVATEVKAVGDGNHEKVKRVPLERLWALTGGPEVFPIYAWDIGNPDGPDAIIGAPWNLRVNPDFGAPLWAEAAICDDAATPKCINEQTSYFYTTGEPLP